MKGLTRFSFLNIMLLTFILWLAGCADNQGETDADGGEDFANETQTDDQEEMNSQDEEDDDSKSVADDSTNEDENDDANDTSVETSNPNDTNDSTDEEAENEEDDALSAYSSEEIEYARVWAQLGANQDIEAVDVTHIPAGASLNPDEEDIDVSYPEDVIQLRGSRIVDGMVTYSGNGDGTINVYNIPYRWYGGMPRPDDVTVDDIRKEMEEIIENTELVYIDPGNDEEIINIIDKLYIY